MSYIPDGPVPLFGAPEPAEVVPTMAGLMLGLELRELRGERRLGVIAKAINASVSKVSRMERAESPPDLRDVRELTRYHGVSQEKEQFLLGLAQRATEPEWFEGKFSDCATQWMKRLMGLEAQCAVLMTFEAFIVPGLLQTDEYARHIIHGGLAEEERTPLAISQRTELRAERQRRFFANPERPRASFLLDESILYRLVGCDTVMHAQVQKLLDLMEDPRVNIRIVPFTGKVVSNHGSMTHLRFDEGRLPPIVYVEGNDNADYHMLTKDVERHVELLLRLSKESAVSRRETKVLLRRALERYPV
ncbi:helix-turn-helix domain-containing protein [Streptomyces sp. NPDC088915]|uniref:helix-turn-helix domain-containing protein n=1 Tax=Streptomyces sp. NPDC088915 TaxID=3365912 RepID=UPI00381C6805